MADHVNESRKQVTITIDAKHHESPTPTTGKALYALGDLQPEHKLYRESPDSKREDPPVPQDDSDTPSSAQTMG